MTTRPDKFGMVRLLQQMPNQAGAVLPFCMTDEELSEICNLVDENSSTFAQGDFVLIADSLIVNRQDDQKFNGELLDALAEKYPWLRHGLYYASKLGTSASNPGAGTDWGDAISGLH